MGLISSTSKAEPERNAAPAGTLGTFSGVFTPSILTILGLILFLRFGYIVGYAGLLPTLLILTISTTITVLTALSLSAIATNLRTKGGGDYYLISRTLGPGFGGALGLVLFLAQSVSIAFYCIGFGEAVARVATMSHDWAPRIIAAAAMALLFVFAWLGSDWATRFQYFVMLVLIAALTSFFIGGVSGFETATLRANLRAGSDGPGFWTLFAIFFPAVTGFTQGVSMSGDLKDPRRSLPRGTFWAIAVATAVYLAVAFLLAGAVPLNLLAGNDAAMQEVAWWPWLVLAGVIAATLSSAMASFLGAPRILQALSRDRIFESLAPFAHGHGSADNPRRAVLFSAAIALVTISAGELNVIAPIVSMFFLISYGLLNYATYVEIRTKSPSFRPTFRWYHAKLSLLGAIGCLAVMLAIDVTAGAISVAILFGVYQYLIYRADLVGFYDSRRANAFQRVRGYLHDMAAEPEHPRDWRPLVLVFSDDVHRRERLLRFAGWIEGGAGMTTVVKLVPGEGALARKQADETVRQLREDIQKQKLEAFALAIAAPDVGGALNVLLQSYGVGPVTANTVLLNWIDGAADDDGTLGQYGRPLHDTLRLGRNIVILSATEEQWEQSDAIAADERRIDLWWWGGASSRLMLLLAHLMARRSPWADAKIRVLAASGTRGTDEVAGELQQMLEEFRVDVDVHVIAEVSGESVREHSAGAALVMLPLRFDRERPATPIPGEVDALLNALPMTALCAAAQEFDLDAEPDEGHRVEAAAAAERLKQARERLYTAEKAAAGATIEAQKKAMSMERALTGGDGLDAVAAAVAEAAEASRAATDKTRRATKAIAKVTHAAEDAKGLGIPISTDSPQPPPT